MEGRREALGARRVAQGLRIGDIQTRFAISCTPLRVI